MVIYVRSNKAYCPFTMRSLIVHNALFHSQLMKASLLRYGTLNSRRSIARWRFVLGMGRYRND